jgi:transcriptional regulator with XRE-family HTH domain
MSQPFEDTLGRRIISARMRQGAKQGELVRAIGISQNTLVKIEKGHTAHPRSDIIRDIARVLRVSADYLLGLKDDMDPEDAPAVVA